MPDHRLPDRPSAGSSLREQVAHANRRVEALEAAYRPSTVGRLVTDQARRLGSKTAIDIFERGERATYQEMDARSNRCANALRAFGVRKGDRVGVMLPNRIEFPLLWFALAKLGAVMVPINTRYTPREIGFVLSDTQARFAVVDESAWAAFAAQDPWPTDLERERVLVVGQAGTPPATPLGALLERAADDAPQADVQPDDLLGIQYTSGTTGFPKGCMLTHDYWCVSAFQAACLRDFEAYERQLGWSPFFYTYGLTVLLKCWRQGGTLHVAQQLSASRLMDWVRTHRIEWCSMPELVARRLQPGGASPLRQVGQYDGWAPDTVRHLRRCLGVRGLDSYGMTEIAYATLPPDIEAMDDSGSVGLRAALRELRIVGDDGAPAPVGDVGEMWVRGPGVLQGYWNRPDANAELFEDGWFKTGDLVRRDDLGFHWLVGRRKDMIRRSGENIAAREVEAVIRCVPGIEDVALVPVKDDRRGEEARLCVELKPGIEPGEAVVEGLLAHARAHLAPFKVPRYIAFVARLPRTTSSHKVAKAELAAGADALAGAYDVEERRWR